MNFEDVEGARQLYNEKMMTVKDIRERAELYSQYKKAYKAYFVDCQLRAFFSEINYEHNKGIDASFLESTGLIDVGDTYYSNDLVKGKYKNIDFTQADAEIIKYYQKSSSDEYNPIEIDTRSKITFKGRFLIFEFSKKIFSRVAILPRYAESFFVNPVKQAGLKDIETESTDFNKVFKVYAEDGFEAFYILDPAFIECTERFGDRYQYKVSLYFIKNKMIIGINDGNDSFEPPDPALTIEETTERAKILENMKIITDVVASLNIS